MELSTLSSHAILFTNPPKTLSKTPTLIPNPLHPTALVSIRNPRCTKAKKLRAVTDVETAGVVVVDPIQAEITWQIVLGTIAGVTPFVVAGIEFSKRIVAQRNCKVCGGSGLVLREKYYFRCPGCGILSFFFTVIILLLFCLRIVKMQVDCFSYLFSSLSSGLAKQQPWQADFYLGSPGKDSFLADILSLSSPNVIEEVIQPPCYTFCKKRMLFRFDSSFYLPTFLTVPRGRKLG
ncbi:hypothetical protein AKJ16_DCAP05231 [Drosera capensis]